MPIFREHVDGEPLSGRALHGQPASAAAAGLARGDAGARWSRMELMDRLKRGDFSAAVDPSRPCLPRVSLPPVAVSSLARPPASSAGAEPAAQARLLPPALIGLDAGLEPPASQNPLGLDMQRPRSALHSGDFTLDKPPRLSHAPSRPDDALGSPWSWSVSSSFAYHPPTSPLVQSQVNDQSPASSFTSPSDRPGLCHRSLPSQAHQPRRSLTLTPAQSWLLASSPQTPVYARCRRPSVGPDLSPLQHASMVGSYEESILRGRMSTTPSKPFEFLAQIGVLGRAKATSTLVCPPHVTLQFPAVYYKYNSAPLGLSHGPSPYVGLIDLENGLPNPDEESRSKRKAHSRNADTKQPTRESETKTPVSVRNKRHGISPRAPPGGSYRIPEKGQLQIIIKNQNKTAVKLFLVPYDLDGMEPGTKTFIRQRSYSSAPPAHDEAQPPDTIGSRPILRYLIHMHICCPCKGRFYLYKSMRVVFANRVVDGKETLRNEITWPEPRFTPYKPLRVMRSPAAASSLLVADKASRRHSLGLFATPSAPIVFENAVPAPSITMHSTPAPGQASWGADQYEKLRRGDAGYGGHGLTGLSAPDSMAGVDIWDPEQRPLAGAESLLSQRLRSLGVKSWRPQD